MSLISTKMSIRRSKSNKKKDPIGTAVFYPNSLPPPPRKSSRSSEESRGSSSTTPHDGLSPAIPARASSLQAIGQAISPCPFDNATEYSFPQQSPSHSPSQLTSMLENWSVFTPSPQSSMDRFPGLYAPDSAADLSILSPDALSLSDLIEESLFQDDLSPSDLRRRVTSPYSKSSLHIDSPAPRAGLFTTSPLPPRTNAVLGQSAFFLGSPQPLPPSPLARPIPFRQPSWLTAAGPRRASAPNVSVEIPASPFASPLYLPPSPLRSNPSSGEMILESTTDRYLPSYGALPNQPGLGEIFSPASVLETSNPPGPDSQYSFPSTFNGNTLDLHFDEPFGAPALPQGQIQHRMPLDQYQHKHEATNVSDSEFTFRSEVAAEALRYRVLNAEFVKRYEIRDELGHGGFGFVCSAVQTGYQNQPGVEVAVKFIYKNRIKEWDHAVMHGEPVESYVLSRCRHPNIIAYVSLFEDTEFWYLVSQNAPRRH